MALIDGINEYWKLEDTAAEVNGNTLTNNNSVSFASAGIIGNGATLVRSSVQTLSCGTSTSLSFTTDFTWSMWLKPTSAPSGTQIYGLICKRQNNSGGSSYRFSYISDSGTYLYLDLYSTGEISRNWAIDLGTGAWKHVVVTFDASAGEAILYVNNVAQATKTGFASTIDTSTSDFVIGDNVSDSSVGNLYNGMIDELGIWSRTLSATEISQLYNDGAGNQYPFSSNAPLPTFFHVL